MNCKERFLNTLSFKSVDRIPYMEFGLWPQTRFRWENEGLIKDAIGHNDEDNYFLYSGNSYFQFEKQQWVDVETWLPYPWRSEEVLEENDRYLFYIDNVGRKRKALKTGTLNSARTSMDEFLEYPVKDRDSFLQHKKNFEGNNEKRYLENYNKLKLIQDIVDEPINLLPPRERFGFYSMLRSWIGTEALSYMFYDNPLLINEAIEFLTEYGIGILKRAIKEIKCDFIDIHEDMCYKNGPLVSPEIFKKFFLKSYKKFIEFLKSNGIKIVLVDTDGNFEVLIPLFLEAGVDGFWPLEVASGMDPVMLRKKYGKAFSISGGIDKRVIAAGKREIDIELKRLTPVIEEGGYIPTLDHAAPPDISFKNFMYYIDLKRKIIFGNY
ncbi:MAG: hypothetical protein M1365_01130 [Actinobacteria bacterium]|nr:hypothetical protein [Actinomycetota bacterium]